MQGPKRADLKTLDDEQRQLDEEDEGSDTSQGIGMLGLGSLGWAWSMREVHAPDKYGVSEFIYVDDEEDVFLDCLGTNLPDIDGYSDSDTDGANEMDLVPFSNIDSESDSEDDDEVLSRRRSTRRATS